MRGPPTKNPFRVLITQVQFVRHLVETIDRISYAVHHFEMFTYDPIDRDSGKCELRTISVSDEGYQSRKYSRWQWRPRHPSTSVSLMLLLPTPSRKV